jgi:hypothetical protein
VELFGHSIRSLWATGAWFGFHRARPARDMVAVKHGHLFVLKFKVAPGRWMVHDYNSGHHKSHVHVRSIAGWTIVNPFSNYALVHGRHRYANRRTHYASS